MGAGPMESPQQSVELDTTLKMARLYFERGDNIEAVAILESKIQEYKDTDREKYLECAGRLLRSYVELLANEKIDQLIRELDLWAAEGNELRPKTYYTLAICESYKGNHEKALELCNKSLNIALKTQDKDEICYAITGLSISYYNLNRLQDALREIYNLTIFFESHSNPQLLLASQLINAHIYRKMGKYPQALEIIWGCYDKLKEEKTLHGYISVLFGMGLTYKESGDLVQARTYLELANRAIDKKNLPRHYQNTSELLKEIAKSSQSPFDMVYDMHSHSITEKVKGKIDFKNQFILLEMLKLFLAHPGTVFSKEELIETIWKQSYNPSVHDNKIYVTIKRLRKVIEPDYNKPKYIFLAKNGYYFSKDVKVQVQGIEKPMHEEPVWESR